MKKPTFLLLQAIMFLPFTFKPTPDGKDHTINPVSNDISFVHKFGTLPNSTTNDDLRIMTHHAYAETSYDKKTCLAYLTNFIKKEHTCPVYYIVIG